MCLACLCCSVRKVPSASPPHPRRDLWVPGVTKHVRSSLDTTCVASSSAVVSPQTFQLQGISPFMKTCVQTIILLSSARTIQANICISCISQPQPALYSHCRNSFIWPKHLFFYPNRRLLAHFHCISCDRPLEMVVPGP